ncbi:MAG: pyridoxamine 5'-phosphate oxidase family protein [Anaerolineae bacterium]|nr:pyridoxamine 5'-phosphate oxidase family protein [Anaerolineae bacterium]
MVNVLFSDVITSMDELRAIVGMPSQRVIDKVHPEIDELSAAWIAASPFVLIGTADAQGNQDVSPKGDPAGFVRVLNSTTLLIPDRPGNHRVDTLGNILQNPKVGLIFLVPGKQETLRVNGRAQIVRDAALREQFAINGKLPALWIAVQTEEVYFHCAKCILRSGLWDAEAPAEDAVPTMAEILIKQMKFEATLEQAEEKVRDDYATLY